MRPMRRPTRFFPPLRFWFPVHLAFAISGIAGCSERLAAPLSIAVPRSEPVLTIWADGIQVAEIADAATIRRIVDELPVPPRNPNDSDDSDDRVYVTRVPQIIAAVRRYLPAEPMRGGFSGHIRHVTWGELKTRLANR